MSQQRARLPLHELMVELPLLVDIDADYFSPHTLLRYTLLLLPLRRLFMLMIRHAATLICCLRHAAAAAMLFRHATTCRRQDAIFRHCRRRQMLSLMLLIVTHAAIAATPLMFFAAAADIFSIHADIAADAIGWYAEFTPCRHAAAAPRRITSRFSPRCRHYAAAFDMPSLIYAAITLITIIDFHNITPLRHYAATTSLLRLRH